MTPPTGRKTTYPDGTTDLYSYDKLDLGRRSSGPILLCPRCGPTPDCHRPARPCHKVYYYKNGELKSLTDPNGHTTRWDIDVAGRPNAKIYADGTQVSYAYENATSRLASMTDALGQVKNYPYTLDDRLAGISYAKAVNTTPDVAFGYDPYFPRVSPMDDGAGRTRYSYVPAGALGALQLAQQSGPLPNGKITYAYDALGRIVTRTVGGATPEHFRYDAIDRLTGHTDALGHLRAQLSRRDRAADRTPSPAAASRPHGVISQ